ncbi:MAG TPA: nucleoside monophosphate kinase [Candidatus Megaira endosymbiont of Nemacystus decipiens]|nr:nucleoside monophosphate kinase [Candidatus Megaera endosymbiont of Nemacystus decipiens]
MKKIFFLMGAPGSGKGTQARLISKTLSIPYLSVGDMFRSMLRKKDERSKILSPYINAGKLVPSEITNLMIKDFLDSKEYQKGVILDGYPRTISQLNYFISNISNNVYVIFFDLEEELVIKRITGRFNCSACNKLYNKYFSPPRQENVCDDCGKSDFIVRSDDERKIIIKRLEEFRNETLPVIKCLKNYNNFFKIDAAQSISDIEHEVCNILKNV